MSTATKHRAVAHGVIPGGAVDAASLMRRGYVLAPRTADSAADLACALHHEREDTHRISELSHAITDRVMVLLVGIAIGLALGGWL